MYTHSSAKITNAVLKIVKAFLDSGEEEVSIRPVMVDDSTETSVSAPLIEEISWEILEKIPDITKDITWVVRKNDCDELCIVLINEQLNAENVNDK